MKALSDVDVALLDALATYSLLTIKQCARLGIGDRWHIGDRLQELKGQGLVKILKRPKMRGPYLHWLTARGAALVEELAEDAGEPRKVGVRRTEFKLGPNLRQRELITDCHLALRQWAARPAAHGVAQARVDWVRVEFAPSDQPLTKATALEWKDAKYEADMLASVTTAKGESWLLAVEVETGGEAESLDNFSKRLQGRLHAIAKHVPERALGWPPTELQARLLFVFKTAAMLEDATRRVGRPEAAVWRRVHMAAAPDGVVKFDGPWWHVDGESPLPFCEALGSP